MLQQLGHDVFKWLYCKTSFTVRRTYGKDKLQKDSSPELEQEHEGGVEGGERSQQTHRGTSTIQQHNKDNLNDNFLPV